MIKFNIKKLLSIGLISTMIFTLSACGTKNSNGTSSDKENKKQLILATSADYPPYEFHKVANGKDEIVGFDIAIAKEIAKDLNAELVIKELKFDALIASLTSGNSDMVLAGLTPDEERVKSVDFSKIYYKAVQSIVIRAEDKDKFKNLDSLKGISVGAQKGSIQEELATKNIKDANLKSLGKVPDLILELKNKKVDAIVVEKPVAENYVKANKDLVLMDITLQDNEGGSAAAIKKGNKELVDSVNKTLDRLEKEDMINKFVAEANEIANGQ